METNRTERRRKVRTILAACIPAAMILLFGCTPQEGTTPVTDEMKSAALAAIDEGEMPEWTDWAFDRTERGVRYLELRPGTGQLPDWGNTVRVHYRLWLTDGTPIDSSLDNGSRPFEFKLGEGRVVAGWENVVRHLRAGGTYLLVIPPELGYGRQGSRTVPGNATLVFSMEIVGIR